MRISRSRAWPATSSSSATRAIASYAWSAAWCGSRTRTGWRRPFRSGSAKRPVAATNCRPRCRACARRSPRACAPARRRRASCAGSWTTSASPSPRPSNSSNIWARAPRSRPRPPTNRGYPPPPRRRTSPRRPPRAGAAPPRPVPRSPPPPARRGEHIGRRGRQFVAATGRFAEPERNGRRHPVRVLDPHYASLHAYDAIALVAELEDVAGLALDREILVHRADEMVLGLEQHLIVGVVRDRASGCQGGEPRAAPATQQMVDAVERDERAAPAAGVGEPARQHAHHRREILPRHRAVGGGAAHERIELVLVPFARGHFGDDLLRQHVERPLRD